MIRNLLACPVSPPSGRLTSHRGAQAAVHASEIAHRLGNCDVNWGGKMDRYEEYTHLWLYHGNDYSGAVNLFGGISGFSHIKNIVNMSYFRGVVYSIGHAMPDLVSIIKNRIEKAQTQGKHVPDEWFDIDFDNLQKIQDNAILIRYPSANTNMVIGDSHAISMHRPGWTVNSVPFTTLNGALNRSLESFIDIEGVTDLEVYFGNIDIRHHICRLEPIHYMSLAQKLAVRYARHLRELPIDRVTACELLPIENESRSVPATGCYKGQPFYGTWQQRTDARNIFNDTLDAFVNVKRWTAPLLNDKGELDFANMEKPRSIHLSRAAYPHWN